MKSSLQRDVDDGSGRLGEEQHNRCCRTRQCDDLGCCFVEEEEEVPVVCGRPEVASAVVFPKVPFWRESLAQFLELKHRTKLKKSPPEDRKFVVSNVEFERSRSRRWLKPAKLAWLVMASVLLFSVLVTVPVQGNEIRPSQVRPGLKKGEVCGSVDVRNSPTNLERLKDCVVVEGFVHILLIDKYTEASFENYTFPLLTEITEYLLLFRVNGLRTLQKLFPNLTVIRGKKLVTNYAIVIYELMHIEEVGLSSLMYIQRGGVRIEKNPKLCFANTVDWDAIAPQSEIYIKDNQKDDVCPICPAETDEKVNGTRKQCPNATKGLTQLSVTSGDSKMAKKLCWNSKHCQNSE